jgi:hypothetical protein
VLRRAGVDPGAWEALRARLKRAESGWVVYPQMDGTLTVYFHAGTAGALVTCLTDELASDYAGLPANERIRRPRRWALHKQASGGGERTWKLLGASTKTHRAPDILRSLGLYRGEADEAAVPLNAWEVHDFTVPSTSATMRLLEQAFDLEVGRGRPAVKRQPEAVVA